MPTADARAASVLAIDGRSGSGKTRLASKLAAHTGARVVHVEHFYPGWHGLAAGASYLVDEVLAPLARGETVRLREWDWYRDEFREGETVHPDERLIVEGCGALTRASRPYVSCAVWLDAPVTLRRTRATTRDQDATWWDDWARQEDAFYQAEQSRELADFVFGTNVSADEVLSACGC